MDRGAWRTPVFMTKQQPHRAEFEYELYSQGIFSCNPSLQPPRVHIKLVQWLYGDVNSGDGVEGETGGVFVDAKPVQFQPHSFGSSLVPQGADHFQISFPGSQNHKTSSWVQPVEGPGCSWEGGRKSVMLFLPHPLCLGVSPVAVACLPGLQILLDKYSVVPASVWWPQPLGSDGPISSFVCAAHKRQLHLAVITFWSASLSLVWLLALLLSPG